MSSLRGVLVVDKPAGITSFGVVKAVRRALGVSKAGHTGTLDPMATGVLPVCVGEATKIASLLLADDKAYTGVARLGLQTDTLDITGQVTRRDDSSAVTRGAVEDALARQQGEILQTPPAFSAIHSGGERAHKKARRGEAVDLAPRRVLIHRVALTQWCPPDFHFVVECGKGAYVRSVVDDVGRAVGCGATLTVLRRTRCGPFDIAQSVSLDEITRATGGWRLIELDEALAHLPLVEVDDVQERRLRSGQPLPIPGPAGLFRLRAGGEVVALGECREGQVWPKRVFNVH